MTETALRRPQPPNRVPTIPNDGTPDVHGFKLYLSMQLIAVRSPYNVTRKAASWAALLSLPDPDVNGARRVNDAIT